MTINPDSPSPGGIDPNFIALPTPGADGEGYSALVIGGDGKPLGENVGDAVVTGFSTTDEISTYLDSLTPTQFLDVTKTLLAQYGSTTDAMQQFLNNIDPTNPDIPPDVLMYLVQIDVALLSSGNIQMVQISNLSASQLDELGITQEGYTAAANLAREDATAATGETGQVPRASNWFAGNVYVEFLVAFMDMARTMMQSKAAQTTIEVAAMNVLAEMAQHQADLIMETAKQNQIQHIVSAVMAGASIAITLGFAAASLKPSVVKNPETGAPQMQPQVDSLGRPMKGVDAKGNEVTVYKTGPDGKGVPLMGPNTHYQLFMNLSTMSSQLEKFVSNITEAAQDLSIAEKEGYQKILETYRTIIQSQMQKAADVFKTQSDIVDQQWSTLNQILDKLSEAIKRGLQ